MSMSFLLTFLVLDYMGFYAFMYSSVMMPVLSYFPSSSPFCQITSTLASAVGLNSTDFGIVAFIAILVLGFVVTAGKAVLDNVSKNTQPTGFDATAGKGTASTDMQLFTLIRDNIVFFVAGAIFAVAILMVFTVLC